MSELRDARRALRAAIRATAAERVLGVIRMGNGGELRVAWYQERHRRPVVSIAVFHVGPDGTWWRDEKRTLRFRVDELPALAASIARGLEEAERWQARARRDGEPEPRPA